MWENNGDDSTLGMTVKKDGISQSYYIKSGYENDILGFEGETSWNIDDNKDIQSNYYLNENTDYHELKWSFRDNAVKESESGSMGTTMFTIIFRTNKEPYDKGKGEDMIYVKEVQEFETDDTEGFKSTGTGNWKLTYTISGLVWLDDENISKTTSSSYGQVDPNDSSIPEDAGLKIKIVEYDENGNWIADTEIEITSLVEVTDTNGKEYAQKYSINKLPPLSTNGTKHYYSVEFTYDGQTYEPTTYLETTSGKSIDDQSDSTGVGQRTTSLNNIRPSEGSSDNYSRYQYSSWAVEDSAVRADFDNDLIEIDGDDTQAGPEVVYRPDASNETRKATATRTSSHLITASTKNAGLTLPVNVGGNYVNYHLKAGEYGSLKVSGDTRYPITEYSQMINFGLVKRDESDLGLSKDLYKAKVVVNKQELDYRYNEIMANNSDEAWKITIPGDTYKLGLYNSDTQCYKRMIERNRTGETDTYTKEVIHTFNYNYTQLYKQLMSGEIIRFCSLGKLLDH